MPSFQRGLNPSPPSSLGIRIGAGLAVVALHAAVVYAIYLTPDNPPELEEPEAIMVSVVEAPIPQVAKADPAPEVPQPVVEPPSEPQPALPFGTKGGDPRGGWTKTSKPSSLPHSPPRPLVSSLMRFIKAPSEREVQSMRSNAPSSGS